VQAITPPVESAGTRTQSATRGFLWRSESPSLSMALPMWRGFHGHLRVSWENAMQVSAILDKQGSILSRINSCDCIGLEQQLAKCAFQFLAAS